MKLDQKNPYIDHQFSPNVQSLIYGYDKYQGEWDKIEWQTFQQQTRPNLRLLYDYTLYQMRQGCVQLKNIVNIISLLCNRPEFIERVFEIKFLNPFVFGIWIFLNGQWELIMLDTQLPVYGLNKNLAFTSLQTTVYLDLWVSLLEKALAKALGSYYRLMYTNDIYTLQNFLGLPFEKLPIFNIKNLWAKIKESLNKNHFLICSFREENQIEKTFMIEEYFEEPLLNLVKLKIGSFDFDWEGEYSFVSKKWNQDLRNKTQYHHNEPKTIWMTLKEFQKTFDYACAFKYFPNYYYSTVGIDAEFKTHKHVMRLDVETDSHVFITLYQKDARVKDQDYLYSYFRITLCSIERTTGVNFILTKFKCKRNITIEKLMKKGNYLILVEPIWSQKPQDFVVGTYSSSLIRLDSLLEISSQEYDRYELLAWRSFCQQNPNQLIEKQKSKIAHSDFIMQVKKQRTFQ